jgi:hypothetical protein
MTTWDEKKPHGLDPGVSSNLLAERTGLEPATPGVTGRYSNQLNYRSAAVSFSAAFAAASRKNRIMHELFFVVKQLVEFS